MQRSLVFVRKHAWLWLIFAVALILRLIVFRDMWIDELTALYQTDTISAAETLNRVPWMHPPLYHLLLHYWVALLGTSEPVLRSLSILVGSMSIPALYAVGYRFFSRNVALVAAALLAVSPYHIWYSQEIRMYVFVGFFAILSVYFFLGLMQGRTGRTLTGYLISTLLAVYSHYTGGFLLAIEVLFGAYFWGFARKGASKGISRRQLLTGLSIAAAVVLPLFVFFVIKSDGVALHPTTATFSFGTAMGAISQVILGFHSLKVLDSQAAMWPVFLYILPLVMLGVGKFDDHKVRFLALVVICLGAGLALAGLGYPFFAPRFLMACFPAVILLSAMALVRSSGSVRRFFLPVVLAGLLLASIDQATSLDNQRRYGQVEAVRYVTSNFAPGDAVLHAPPFLDVMLNYYYPRSLPEPIGVPWSDPWYHQDYGDLRPLLFQLTGKSDRVFLFHAFEEIDPRVPKPLSDIENYLRKQYPYRRTSGFNNISVTCFSLRPAGCPAAKKPKNELIWTRVLP